MTRLGWRIVEYTVRAVGLALLWRLITRNPNRHLEPRRITVSWPAAPVVVHTGPSAPRRWTEGIAMNLLVTVFVTMYMASNVPSWTGRPLPTLLDGLMLLPAINADRHAFDAGPVVTDVALMEIAQSRASMMAAADKLSHSIAGRPSDQMNAAGISWDGFAEVIGWTGAPAGAEAADHANRMFMDSNPHRALLTDGSFERVGLGVAAGRDGRSYWVVLLIRPADAGASSRTIS